MFLGRSAAATPGQLGQLKLRVTGVWGHSALLTREERHSVTKGLVTQNCQVEALGDCGREAIGVPREIENEPDKRD
jgi:hypothetical protein